MFISKIVLLFDYMWRPEIILRVIIKQVISYVIYFPVIIGYTFNFYKCLNM